MKRLLLSGLVSLMLAPVVGLATDYFNPNGGVVTSPPDIVAPNFTNYGIFNIYTEDPFETGDTRNFHNKGLMICANGWWFNNRPSTGGVERLAANFVNENPGVISAVDPFASTLPCAVAVNDPSFLWIWATNINIGSGTEGSGGASLIVGANGWLELVGTNVDISRSGLGVVPVWDFAEASGSFNSTTNFWPDIAVHDKYWVQTNFTEKIALPHATLWDGVTANAPSVPGPTTGPCEPVSSYGFSLVLPEADSYVNVIDSMTVTATNFDGSTYILNLLTNITKGAVFVSAPDDYEVRLGFIGPAENHFDTIQVLLTVGRSNAATALPSEANIFLEDTLASQARDPSRGLLKNRIGCPVNAYKTFRPANYILSRWDSFFAQPGNNGYPDPDFFTSSGNGLNNPNIGRDSVTNLSKAVTVGEYAAYSAYIDNVVSRPQAVSGGAVSNLPGRIRIYADKLDMSRTRLRGEGEIMIRTANLISSTNAVVDCENLAFNLASTNGTLRVQNLAKDNVVRLRGAIYAWSAVWSNLAEVVIMNNYSFTNEPYIIPGTTNYATNVVAVLSPLTNTVTMGLHTLMLDARELRGVLPVSVYDLTTHNTNVVIHDNLSLIQTLSIDARSLTLLGNMTFPGYYPPNPVTGLAPPIPAIRNWTYPLAPNLLYFTNNGVLNMPNETHFGDDGPKPYSVFVNGGTISASSIQLKSGYFQNSGSLFARVGSLIMQGGSGRLQDGISYSGGEAQFLCGSLLFDSYQAFAANNAIKFWVTNSLSDAGPESPNFLEAQNGFNLLVKPATGDLLGTTIQSTAVRVPSVRITHAWAGADRGLSVAGYSNNVAVGRLVLSAQSPDPTFYFAGTGVSNALYVDYLELGDYATNRDAGGNYKNLEVGSNMRIYFAQAVANGQSIAEKLDGQNGGRLRWMRNYTGYYSSTNLVYPDGTIQTFNAALVQSCELDSDCDEMPNCLDEYPVFLVTSASLPDAAANTAYSAQLYAGGGNSPYTWALATGSAPLPNGLTLSPTGLISGTATNTGNFAFTVQASVASAYCGTLTVTQNMSLNVSIAGPVLSLAIEHHSPAGARVAWQTIPNSANYLFYRPSLASGSWQLLTNFVSAAGGAVSAWDPLATNQTRYYRVRVDRR